MQDNRPRCSWCGQDALYQRYHDTEWGIPCFNDQELFEMLNLEGAQAGLSWYTVLVRRENYRAAFANWNPQVMATWGEAEVEQLLQNPGIIRHRLKLWGHLANARAYLRIREEQGSFADFVWRFVGHQPVVNQWSILAECPTQTPASQAMSKALKKAGFQFVGPTICYAFMQATGMVDDHLNYCWRRQGE